MAEGRGGSEHTVTLSVSVFQEPKFKITHKTALSEKKLKITAQSQTT